MQFWLCGAKTCSNLFLKSIFTFMIFQIIPALLALRCAWPYLVISAYHQRCSYLSQLSNNQHETSEQLHHFHQHVPQVIILYFKHEQQNNHAIRAWKRHWRNSIGFSDRQYNYFNVFSEILAALAGRILRSISRTNKGKPWLHKHMHSTVTVWDLLKSTISKQVSN